jgi:RimJ/RimL family protein N-acetyltransferase
MTRFIEPLTLRGTIATLEPLAAGHVPALAAAAQDGELWRLWYTAIAPPDRMGEYVATALDMRERLDAMPFVVRDHASGEIVGCTRYFNVDTKNRRLEIGHTWYARRVQRTSLNTECKLLLLGHAFEQLGCIAVEFRTHFFNQQSRRGIERLGARLDGILRNHQRASNGTLRDTCVYSITADEWPTVQAHLQFQLDKPR